MAIPAGITIGWPSTAGTIPTGWSRVTALDGKHPKQIPDAVTDPGTAGGAAQHHHTTNDHTHTISHTHATANTAGSTGTVTVASAGSVDTNQNNHVHATGTISATTATTEATNHPDSDDQDNDPVRWDVIWIESNGTPTSIPEGAITFWNNASLPASWTQPANGKNRLPRGAAAAGDGGATGGGSSHTHAGGAHTHSSDHVHPNATGAAVATNTSESAGTLAASDAHTHDITVTTNNFGTSVSASYATSGAATPAPPWIKQAIITPPAGGDVLQIGLIALWLGTLATIPGGWVLCDGNNGTPNLCQGLYVMGCDLLSELLATGGTTTHGHTAGAAHTHTWSSSAHTHVLTVAASAAARGVSGSTSTQAAVGHAHANSNSGAANALTVGNASPNSAMLDAAHDPLNVQVAFIMYSPPGASYAGDLDTSIDVDVTGGNVQKRLRIAISNTGTAVGASAFKLRYSKNGGAYADVTASSSNVKTFDTSHFADGDDVGQLIDTGTYQADNNAAEENTGAFTLTAGLAALTKFECEIALEFIAADLADNDSLDFRVTQSDGTVLDTYTNTANATITKGAGFDPATLPGIFNETYQGGMTGRVYV